MSPGRALVCALAAAATALACTACGAADSVAPDAASEAARLRSPHVEDIFDEPPDALLVVRPQAIKHDPLYGPLWQRAMRVALTRGGAAVAGDRALEAVSGADSVVIGVSRPEGGAAVVALRGVSAGLEPTRLRDAEGRPLWQNVATNGVVTEFAPVDETQHAVLFVLPGREWVFVLGDETARMRARRGFARPRGLPAIEGDDASLALFRLRGDTLVGELRQLQRGLLAPIGAHLGSLALSLAPGNARELSVTFRYADAASATAAESRVRDVLKALAEAKTEDKLSRFGWLRAAVVVRDGAVVDVRTRVPPQLLKDLPTAGSMPLEL